MNRNLFSIVVLLFAAQVVFGQSNPQILIDSAEYYFDFTYYAKALPIAQKAVDLAKTQSGETHLIYARALNTLAKAQAQSNHYEDAKVTGLMALNSFPKAPNHGSEDLANSYDIMGVILRDTRDFTGSMDYFLKALETLARGPKTNRIVDSGLVFIHIGSWHELQNEIPQASDWYTKGLERRQLDFGVQSRKVADGEVRLAMLYYGQGQVSQAESHFKKTIEIRKKELGPMHPLLANTIEKLGELYSESGNPTEAERCYNQVLAIRKAVLGEWAKQTGDCYNNLGILYSGLGFYQRALTDFSKSLEIFSKVLGPEDNNVGNLYHNSGNMYLSLGQYDSAYVNFRKALTIKTKIKGKEHFELGGVYQSLGFASRKLGLMAQSFRYIEDARRVWVNGLGENAPVDMIYRNLGGLNADISHYAKSQENYSKLLAMLQTEPAFKDNSGGFGDFYCDLGTLSMAQGLMEKAETYFLKADRSNQFMIEKLFPNFSDNERQDCYETFAEVSATYKSFCSMRALKKPSIAGQLYNHQLSTKSLLLNSSAKWKHRIKMSADKKLLRLFADWEANQNQLAGLYQSSDSVERAGIDTLFQKTETLEKELSRRSENFAELTDNQTVHWQQVQKLLKPGEAAIEMVRLRKYGIAHTFVDTSDAKKPTYRVKGLTDTIQYAALILKPGMKFPELVLLTNGNDLEKKYLHEYTNRIKLKSTDPSSYEKYWGKIAQKLKGTTRVYFSPDGVYHQINLNTLYDPQTKKYLLEECDIRLVTATKDLLRSGKVESRNKIAYLLGHPDFYTSAQKSEPAEQRRSPKSNYMLNLDVEVLAELPSTKVEVVKIGDLLQQKGYDVQTFTESNALEGNLKESFKPKILHIATHGYFQPDSTAGSNPLLRSGLLLSGAGSSLKGEKSETGEDGILTAYEAMNLNLDNTDLVVLSACETGLGEIKNGEGVYGLQRAFKVAGAKSIIMSLWKVDDDATQELMVGFYRNWLGSDGAVTLSLSKGGLRQAQLDKTIGNSKRSAFLAAQKELKAKYPNPYYWGAFVMVGE